jgi:hypothetical protein
MPRPKKYKTKETKTHENAIIADHDKVVKFIDDIIKNNIKIQKEKDQERLSDYNNLVSINSEWLDSFFIIGYNLDGEEVFISKQKNIKDYNSLLTLLKKVFINLVIKNE